MKKKPRGGRTALKRRRPIIGWKEWVRFPELGVAGIRSKVDTGARTSALHAIDVREFDVDGTSWVRFAVHCEHESTAEEVTVELPLVDRRPIRDSGGREEIRPVVRAAVELGGKRWQIELTLTRRDDMEFNMLLGRRAVRGRFLIDPKREYVLGGPGELEVAKKKSRTGKMARRKATKKTATRKQPSKTRAAKKQGRKTTTEKKPATKKAASKKSIKKRTIKKKTSKKKKKTKTTIESRTTRTKAPETKLPKLSKRRGAKGRTAKTNTLKTTGDKPDSGKAKAKRKATTKKPSRTQRRTASSKGTGS